MTLLVPAHLPSYGASVKTKYRVLTNSFGDGYKQFIQDGLNNIQETWDLTWDVMSEVNANDLEDQLNSFAGTTFEWVTPKGVTKKFTCESLTKRYIGFNYFSVSATFEESFS